LNWEPMDIDNATTRHELQLTLWETDRGFEGAFTYSTELFDAETIGCFVEQFKSLVDNVVNDPEIRLSVLRTRIHAVGHDYRQRMAKLLEEASHQKLRSVKRRRVSDQL
jgi:hypothetical protein